MASEKQPWERIPGPKSNPSKGEGDEAFDAFNAYLELGPSRTIDAVRRELGKSATICERWSARWKWVSRASAWDDHFVAQRRKRLMKNLLKREERRLDRDDQNYEAGLKMQARVMEGLAFPMMEVVVEVDASGRAVKVVKPTRWSAKDLAIMAKTAQSLLDAATAPLPGASFDAPASGDLPRGPMFVEVEEVRRDDQPVLEPPESEGG